MLASNTGQTTDTGISAGTGSVSIAQGFTTGSNAAGYTLESIGVEFGGAANATQSATVRAELWSAAGGGGPGSKIGASLTVPSTISAGSVATFTAPASTTLDASTTYYVVVYTVGAFSPGLSITSSNSEDSGSWSIADAYHWASVDEPVTSTSWTSETSGTALQIVVNGAAKTTTTTTPSAIWSATLTVDQDTDVNTFFGCDNNEGTIANCSTALTEDEFTYGSKTYTVTGFYLESDTNLLTMQLSSSPSPNVKTELGSLTLNVGSTAISVSDSTAGVTKGVWSFDPNPDWTDGQTVSLSLTGQATQSSDATLSGLSASSHTQATGTFSALTLMPSTFAPATTAYTATVANARTHLKLTATVNESNATVKYRKGTTGNFTDLTSGTASAAISLDVGTNTITVRVTAQDTTTTEDYTVTITRQAQTPTQSSDNTLSGLSASSSTSSTGTFSALGIGTFVSTTTSYTATVPYARTHVKLTPTVNESNASVKVGKGSSLTSVSSGSASAAISLTVGANAITVRVTAQDSTTKDYTVTITRQAQVTTPLTVKLSASLSTVTEGYGVGITASLTRVPPRDLSIPLIARHGTSKEGDWGDRTFRRRDGTQRYRIIIISSHQRSFGIVNIRTHRNAYDDKDRTFTVELDTASLPAGVTAGTPSSVTITITDDGYTPPRPSSSTGGGGGGGGLPSQPSTDEEPPPSSDEEPSTSCPQGDREILRTFYEMTDGEGWERDEHWDSEEPLGEWHGVVTDEDGEVVSLRLADNGLSGDMPARELRCLKDKELVELALWDNDDLEGEVPEELVLAVERAALRYLAETLGINPGWFEDYEEPYDFTDWHEGVTIDDEGRVTGLDLTGEVVTGEIPENIRELLPRLGEITVTRSSEGGGCAIGASQAQVGVSVLLAAALMLLVFSRGLGARSD